MPLGLVKALRILGGLFFLLFGLGLILSMGHHLAHPNEPRHVSRLLTSLGLLGLDGYLVWTLFFNAFADPNRARLVPGGELFGTALLQAAPDRLSLRPSPKTRVKNLLIYGCGLAIFGLSLPVSAAHHRWGGFAFSLLVVLFDLFMVVFTLLRWRDECVWDRAADLFTRNGLPVRPLSQIVAVETDKRKGVYHTILACDGGARIAASPALTVFARAEDAERFRLALQAFLGLAPPPGPVWPPPPAVPVENPARIR